MTTILIKLTVASLIQMLAGYLIATACDKISWKGESLTFRMLTGAAKLFTRMGSWYFVLCWLVGSMIYCSICIAIW